MNGRRLYDKYTDAHAAQVRGYLESRGCWGAKGHLLAWPFLTDADQRVWNDLAKRVTPKPRIRS